jgi:HAE1 family hydrophobic/amphiphilic exporter-1
LLIKQFQKIAEKHPGVSLSFGGEFESTSKSYTSLTFAFFIALLLIDFMNVRKREGKPG